MSTPDRVRAFRDERAGVLAFCESLAPADWRMNSRAQGWSIHDVVAHMGAGAHAMFGPAAVKLMRGKDIERLNDEMVVALAVTRECDKQELRKLVEKHFQKTKSEPARSLLANWDTSLRKFVRVIAKERAALEAAETEHAAASSR